MHEIVRGQVRAGFNPKSTQLCSLKLGDTEFMHPGGRPDATEHDQRGWKHSELIMFPIVGKPAEYESLLECEHVLSQHGLPRHMKFLPSTVGPGKVGYWQRYEANKEVDNTKFPAKDEPAKLWLPYSFDPEFHSPLPWPN